MKDFFRKLFGQKLINFYHLCQAVLANFIYGFPSRKLKVIGVTGTDGKTTTVNLIASILQAAGHKTSFLSTINAQIGERIFDTGLHTTTPSPFLLQKLLRQMVVSGSKFAVLEVTSHALDQFRTWGIVFETAVLTNITPEHLDYHETFEEYAKAKMRMFRNVEYRIVNMEDSTSLRLSPLACRTGRSPGERVSFRFPSPRDGEGLRERLQTYGLTAKAKIWADHIKEDLKSTDFICHIENSTLRLRSGQAYNIHLNLPGQFNVLNALAAICVGQIYQIPQSAVILGLEHVHSIPGRMEYIDEGQNFLAIVDFAHTPNALRALTTFSRPRISGQLILVFGAAGERDPFKRPEMGKVADEFADIIVITREDNRSESAEKICKQIASGIRRKKLNHDYFIIPDRHEAIRFAFSKAKQGDIVIVTGKGHEQSLNIDGKETPWDDRKVMREELKKAVSSK